MTSSPNPLRDRGTLSLRLGGAALWLGVAALALWSARPEAWLLTVASGGLGAALLLRVPYGPVRVWGLLLLLGGILVGFSAHRQVDGLGARWDRYWEAREAEVGRRLEDALEDRLAAVEGAASALAGMAQDSIPNASAPLRRIRRSFGVAAVALYGPAGDLLAWDGTHRGRVPEEVQRGLRRYAYGDLPLFGYLYVTEPTGSGGTAMAAVLLRTDLPGALAADAGDFASSFRREVGEPIRMMTPRDDDPSAGWDWKLGERTLFTVVLDPPSPEVRGREILSRWRLWVWGAAFGAGLLLAVGVPAGAGAGVPPGMLLAALVTLAPLHEVRVLAPLFDPEAFALPGPVPLSLGRVALLAVALLLAAALRAAPVVRWGSLRVLGTFALLGPLIVGLWSVAGEPDALVQGRWFWVVYQGALAAALTAGIVVSLQVAPERRGPTPVLAWLALPVAGILGSLSGVWVWMEGPLPLWVPLLWVVPLAMVGAGRGGAVGGWTGWITAALLAATLALPFAWGDRVEARRHVAEAYLQRMATAEDPRLEEGLRRLGDAAVRRATEGQGGVGLLYGAWRESGLAELGAPAWLTLWTEAGVPEEELRVGVAERPVVSYEVQEDPREGGGVRILRYDRDDARYVMRLTLPGGRVLTAAAPPFADPHLRTGLSPLLGGSGPEEPSGLALIPVAAWEGSREGLRWSRTRAGWRAELPLSFSNALYQGQYTVARPGAVLALARATLLLSVHLLLVLGVRAAGRLLTGGGLPRRLQWRGIMLSFRGRVTLALFAFFVLAVALFGTLAYRSIAGASWRTAQVLAERVADDAAGWYLEVSGRMQALSRRVGVELLEYRGGELRDGSVSELVELGLYEGWLPMDVKRSLDEREEVGGIAQSELGSWAYVTAFRRLPDGDVVAAHVPRQAGASAMRSADVLEILAFAVVLGAALSLGLALLVARALTSPIQSLQVASERVGAGNLTVSLPVSRSDEFGAVFGAFNRMVRRLRRARRQLVRTTRRTQAIMEEAAVGMVALDASGRVTLTNPRAGQILGTQLPVGRPIPASGPVGQDLVAWLDTFLSSGRDEWGVELQDGGRRIRVRARRLGGEGGKGGAVVALEDVTDELHTERVLAWGEMARQVAHEVKNPLTPMKLSAQHIRRAWDDARPDFGDILVRNVDAMLVEIDRLASIAKSFSRFGAPTEGGAVPLEAVDVAQIIDEVMALYRGSEGPVLFEVLPSRGLPQVQARAMEMKEVLVNLLENARAASPPGGRISVGASPDESGSRVLVHVVDRGRGIPESIRARVFEPQFSTRSTGAGLGLAIVQRLVDSWDGTVAIEGGEEGGTRVTLTLRCWPGGEG